MSTYAEATPANGTALADDVMPANNTMPAGDTMSANNTTSANNVMPAADDTTPADNDVTPAHDTMSANDTTPANNDTASTDIVIPVGADGNITRPSSSKGSHSPDPFFTEAALAALFSDHSLTTSFMLSYSQHSSLSASNAYYTLADSDNSDKSDSPVIQACHALSSSSSFTSDHISVDKSTITTSGRPEHSE
jgi:hypothetical protein